MPAPAVRNRKIAIVFAPVQDHVPVSNIRKPIVAAGIALAVALAFACAVAGPLSGVSLALAGIAGAIFLAWSVAYTTRHHEWLLFALLMIEVLTAATAIPANVNTAARYGLEALFCLPIVPAFARSGLWRKGGFRLFLMYLGWALITVSFSLAPMFSLGRIFNTMTLFTALCLCASEVHGRRDLDRLVRTGLLACTLLVALIGISAVVLPSSQIWSASGPALSIRTWGWATNQVPAAKSGAAMRASVRVPAPKKIERLFGSGWTPFICASSAPHCGFTQ
jgi:hypothetical protein